MAQPVLYYFDVPARGELIRLIFHHAKVPFTDEIVKDLTWAALKDARFSEFHKLPRLDIDGMKLVEHRAIVRYIGKKYGLYPSDPVLAYKTDSLLDAKEDFYMEQRPFKLGQDYNGMNRWYFNNGPLYLSYLNDRLEENGQELQWFAGDSLSVADLCVFEWIRNYFVRPKRAMYAYALERFPRLKAFYQRVLDNSLEVRAYVEAREDKWF